MRNGFCSMIDTKAHNGILVSKCDLPLLNNNRWRISKNGYVFLRNKRKEFPQRLLHRIILNSKKGEDTHHKNENKLDNRRENIEKLSPSQHHKYHNHLLIESNKLRRIYPLTKICLNCKEEFTLDVDHRGRNKFCSLLCSGGYNGRKRKAKNNESKSEK